MTEALAQNVLAPTELPPQFPDHTQLPESDGSFVKNFQEHPQSLILTDSIGATLERLHSDGQYAIGQDCGIYWRETEPPEKGAAAPDWFYVPNVPPRLRGEVRRSYVLWREFIAPTIVFEFASGDGSEEHDRTPLSYSEESGTKRPGKFWVYEQIMRIPFYGIFFVNSGELEMYELMGGQYQRMTANSREHYPIPLMEVEIGVWEGAYQNQIQLWLRWWNMQGDLLLTGSERAVAAEEKAARLAERLRELGVDPDLV